MSVLAWWALGGACVALAVILWRRLEHHDPARPVRGENVVEFAPRATRTRRPVPPAVDRRRGGAA